MYLGLARGIKIAMKDQHKHSKSRTRFSDKSNRWPCVARLIAASVFTMITLLLFYIYTFSYVFSARMAAARLLARWHTIN